ncbi:MAG: FHA domain-containing protein [Lachnospiraceae bacterium]|nr:FHA domain-containing protein [Lachnospiraceae bacterium]
MEMRKCDRGHYYDASINNSCPYCKQANVGRPIDATMPLMGGTGEERTMPLGYQAQAEPKGQPEDDGRTVALIKVKQGIDPVTGWLIALDGSEKGRDYRIHTDNNYIGRSEKMDICIRGDETISRENQAVITYDSVEKVYYFSPGEGRSIVRLNNKAIFQTTELKAYDRITLGKTVLLFVPLCGENFEWEEE